MPLPRPSERSRQRQQSEDDGEPQALARNHGDNGRPGDAAGRVLAMGHRGRDTLSFLTPFMTPAGTTSLEEERSDA